MKKLFILLLAAVLLSGCIRYENGKPVNQEEKPKEEQNEEQKEKKAAAPKEEKKEPQVDQQATTDVKKYLDDNFGGGTTAWYDLIQGIEIVNNVVTISTSVLGDEEGKNAVKNIGTAIWGYTNTDYSKYHFKTVNILDKDNHIILSVKNPLE